MRHTKRREADASTGRTFDTWGRVTGQTLAYRPRIDSRRELDAPPGYDLSGGVWGGGELIFWESQESAHSRDWALDPSTGDWTKLPDDPFEPTYDRAYVWTGDRFVFFGVPRRSDDDTTFQVAEYDPSTRRWTRLPDSPVTRLGLRWTPPPAGD